MKVRITMDRDNARPELRQFDVVEELGAQQSAEERIRSYLAEHAERFDGKTNPLDLVAVELVDDSGESWQWKGWGHEKLIRGRHVFNRIGMDRVDASGAFPEHVGE